MPDKDTWPQDARPPYVDEPSLPTSERARRLACISVVCRLLTPVPEGWMDRFEEWSRRLRRLEAATPPGEWQAMRLRAAERYWRDYHSDAGPPTSGPGVTFVAPLRTSRDGP